MLDNFTALARAAARYTHELVLDDVQDAELLEWGDEGRVVLISRCEARLRRLVARSAAAEDAADREDLQQAAILGFLEALAKYDPERGAEPFTYARSQIVKRLQEANRNAASKPVKQSAHDRYCAAMAAMEGDPGRAREWSRLQRLSGFALQDEADAGNDIAAGILDARIDEWERRGLDVTAQLGQTGRGLAPEAFDTIHAAVTYLDAPIGDATEGNAATHHDVLGSEAPQAAYEDVENRHAVASLLDALDERERAIVAGLYGVGGREWTASDLAEAHGVSRPRVLNIRREALRKMAKVAA